MSWINIAKKDFEDSIRSSSLWIVTLIFLVLIAGGTFIVSILPEAIIGENLTSDNAIIPLQGIISLIVPLISLMIGYMAIAGERDFGTIKTLLGLPNTRFDVVLGKWIGRSLVAIVPIAIAFIIASIIIAAFYDKFLITNFMIFIFLTILLAISFLSISIGFSAATDTKTKALGWAVAVYFFFMFLWDTFIMGIYYVINRTIPYAAGQQETLPAWFVFLQRITPNGAFGTLSNELMDLGQFSQYTDISTLIGTETIPFYLTNYTFLATMLIWITIPPILGYLVFRKTDIT
ncbi:MAG: ABC-type transport system permease involved in multi-copper enzyme maturation [Candidatus Methanohalarchaeum thermophilum]|uniref:ABC-type transport system permease involved in multi-copper enzyme maturation n=1 Tax=Methanohalarchaeum thermophilum TaxID=1903181 RepID=A0A1Q6DSI0_METT1|nr:MAG: ABC-type transport system permease involved in multi-copper enzyme maturation [Candidatus Methanohalarchaeum thermophilum]